MEIFFWIFSIKSPPSPKWFFLQVYYDDLSFIYPMNDWDKLREISKAPAGSILHRNFLFPTTDCHIIIEVYYIHTLEPDHLLSIMIKRSRTLSKILLGPFTIQIIWIFWLFFYIVLIKQMIWPLHNFERFGEN